MPASAPNATRETLVEHGLAALLEVTPAQLVSAVGLKDVARRAGVGVTTIYHHFGNVEGFANAIVARVFDPDAFPSAGIADLIGEITAGRFPFEEAKVLHGSDLERLSHDPELRLRLGLWAFGGPGVQEAYRSFLRATEEPLQAQCAAMFAAWEREPQPPFDLASYVAAQVALTVGASVRHIVDPERMDADRFARAGAALTTALTRTSGDPRTLDDRLAEINYYPLHAARARSGTPRQQASRTRLLEAAAMLFARDGHEETTVPKIAKQARVSTSTAYALFSSVEDVAVALLQHQAADHLGPSGVAPSDPLAALLHVVRRVAAFFTPRVGFLAPYGQRLLVGRVAKDDAIVSVLTDAVFTAQEQGVVRADVEVARATLVLGGALVGAVLTRPARGADGAVEEFRALLLPGLLSPQGLRELLTASD
ncbi:TetR/AcrR family transcriptional regulator [Paraconexibacter algicola]|uniref:TetR/AcrR family transcriptional regulator n=1 Tax=Paraconexibacter algicola TaxID=2133960 RepID=UPI001304CD3B|nr:TetR/AcrR family transcriptional regulator [Paraconexibacter algicola]